MKKTYITFTGLAILAFSGCEKQGQPEMDYQQWVEQNEIYNQQQIEIQRQIKEYDQQMGASKRLLEEQEAQTIRYEKLLEKWEEQAVRFDKILDAWEPTKPTS